MSAAAPSKDSDTLDLLRGALEASEFCITIADARLPDCPLVAVNRAFCDLTGYGRDEVIGRNCRFLQGPHSDPAAVASMREAVRTGRECAVEMVNYKKDGTPFDVRIDMGPIRALDGAVIGYFGFQRDITHERARQKLELMGQIAGGFAHEVNNLLQPMLILVDLARDELGAAAHARLDPVLNAAMQMRGLIRALLGVAEQSAGQVVTARPVPAAQSVAEALTLCRAALGSGYRLETDLAALDGALELRGGEVSQILLNLVQNARDAGGRGVVRVGARCTTQALILTVTDEGCGMDIPTQNRVMEAFFTTKARGSGTGLGLTMVQGIVTRLGGRIVIDSRLGAGTQVTVTLPLTASQ